MAASPPKKLVVNCPKCRAAFEIGPELAGQQGLCKCGHVFTLPAIPETPAPAKSKKSPPLYIGVSCRVCGTRLFGLPVHAGKKIKCPDCHAETVLPQPEPEKAPSMPAALEGEQYELWDADAAPSNEAILAAQPKYVAVTCKICSTLMYALPEHVGRKMKCPDCKTVNIVPPPIEPKAAQWKLVDDGEAYQLDESSALAEPPPIYVPPRRPMVYEEEREADLARQAERKARGKRGPRYDVHGRPILPRWPLVTRIIPFLITRGVPARWALLTCTLLFVASLLASGISTIRPVGGMQATGIAVIGGVCIGMCGFVSGVVWLGAFSSTIITIVTESSEGNDEVQAWPATNPADWIGYMFTVVIAGMVSAFPGWLLGQAMLEEPLHRMAAIGVSVWLCFPIVLLSQLDIGSMFGIVSGRLLATFVKCPLSWMTFYMEMVVLAAICLGIAMSTAGLGPVMTLLLAPVAVAAALVAARILGRLAWKLAETMPAVEEADQDGRAI